MEETHAIAGTVIVENPHTGEILALTNRPTFNPNNRKEIKNEALKDRAVSDIYEPGSTFKMVTISAGLEEKITRPDEMFDCQMGSIVINGMRIRDSKPHGMLSVADIIAESSDVGAIKVALASRRRSLLQIHSRLRIRTANRDRTSRRNARVDEAGGSLVESFDWSDLHGPGDRDFGGATCSR